jgi:ketosteroid isomerase-like protein
MRYTRSIVVVALIGFGAIMSFARLQAARVDGKPEDQVRQLELDWLAADAKGDSAALQRIIDDDFIGSSFGGRLLTKGEIIPEDARPGGFAGATPGDTSVRIFGDTGVLMGTINTAGKPQPKPIRVTLVCQKRPEGWQIIAVQLAMQ